MAVAATGRSQAQSLSDAVAGAASNAVAATSPAVTQPDPPKEVDPKFDHWQAKITLNKPSFKPTKKVTIAAQPPFALHGPIADGTVKRHIMKGLASFYGSGERTASGGPFDPNALTAAHRTLPFGTHVRITRVDTGDSIIVRINDRGPFKPGRIIDLSRKAAEDLRMTDKGLTAVKLEVVDREDPPHDVQPHIVENVDQRSLRR